MVSVDVSVCPRCGGALKYYGMVPRIVRTKNRATSWVKIRRLRCSECGAFHRELPELVFPHKQYEAEVILGVLEGFITCETLGFEDYPCELTMENWKSQEPQLLLWRNPYLKGETEHETYTCGGRKEAEELYERLVTKR